MIETIVGATGLIYAIGKDAWLYVKEKKKESEYKEATRTVNIHYPEKAGIEDAWKKKGYEIRWVLPKDVESYKLDGDEILYEIDENKKEIFSLLCWNNDGGRPADLILMAKKKVNP